MRQNAVNLTKNVASATNYHIKQGKLNFVAIFAHNLVTATEKLNNLQKIRTDLEERKWESSCILTVNLLIFFCNDSAKICK
jgi:hypothetical protein